ncbi:flippase-like domain-containing protein [Streptacidiphilus fuscans]|uniref:Flippase-like domain-containing protein n=1 Tax=Streptacidiphilus fuscans TaxID=2789292 RepID=A0A931FFU7_9ACTN|nr:lysylphosphatidylglycerol synthase transmembrane domain-containing protein [Streptacidiphilus fuscans]MBF9068764.1 flippase-like domain-containing protein [Streptacidiphilus fuscans]
MDDVVLRGPSRSDAEETPPQLVSVGRAELLLPARARRPETLVRFVLGLLLTVLTLLVADAAHDTMGGLELDATRGAGQAPRLLLALAGSFASTAVLLVPAAFAVSQLLRHGRRRVQDGLIAATIAFGLSMALNLWYPELLPQAIVSVLTPPEAASPFDGPLLALSVPAIAFMTAAGVARRPQWRIGLAVVVALDVLTALVSGYADALSVLLSLLLGWTTAHGTAYAVGSPNVRPNVELLFRALRQVGFAPTAAFRRPDQPPQEPQRYLVRQADDGPVPRQALDVMVLDRGQSAVGFLHRLGQRLRLRSAPERRSLLSPSDALRQEALLAYAAEAAGVRTRRLLATADLGPDASLAVYEPLPGRTLDQLDDAELTDPLLLRIWQQVHLLHTRRIAHRALTADSVWVDEDGDEDGDAGLVNLQDGDIAAGDLVLRTDLAQLLTTLSLRVGPERAVAAALDVLGPDRLGTAVPVLQPLALPRSTRARVKAQEKEQAKDQQQDSAPEQDTSQGAPLLARIRDEITRAIPEAPVEAVRLERLRPRTLIAVLGLAIAGYLLVLQLSSRNTNPFDALTQARPGWIAVAAVLSAGGFVAATMSFVGFVPERLNLWRSLLAQVAGGFVNIVAPSGLGGMALGTRFLHKQGLPTRQAVASVGVTQAVGLVLHILLIFIFGFLASGQYRTPFTDSTDLVVALLAAGALALLVAAVPPLRRWVVSRLRPMISGILPRMLDLLQQPGKVAVGVLGQLLVSLFSAACLYACALAFGQHPGFAEVTIANLIGGTLGQAVPTPGGVGGVEAVLAYALQTTTGMPYDVALLQVLLYRMLTLWLPALPGWVAYLWLQHIDAV